MAHFALFDDDGRLTALYSDDVAREIPDGAISLSDDEWLDLAENQGMRRYVNGAITVLEPTSPPPLPAPISDPVAKLRAFLIANPDVRAAIGA